MRLLATSRGLDPGSLVAGADLVLALAPEHGLSAPPGTAADDHLDLDSRRDVEASAIAALARWRRAFDRPLTVDGICLPFVLEWALLRDLLAIVRDARALQAAIEIHAPDRLEVPDGDGRTMALAEAVGMAKGIEVIGEPAPGPAVEAVERARRPRLRRRLADRVLANGAPTLLRRGSVLTLTYWPLVPLFDRLLVDPATPVAIPIEMRPPGPTRAFRAAAQGGILGRAGRRADRSAIEGARPRLADAAAAAPPDLGLGPPGLDVLVHETIISRILQSAGHHLATARLLRRAYRRARPRLLLGTYDSLPFPRLAVSLAREAGIPTFLLAHGAYLMPQTLADTDLGDEVAVWAPAVAHPIMRSGQTVHVVGYPLEDAVVADPPPRAPSRVPRILVLGQNGHPYTALIDDRIVMRHLSEAVVAIAAAVGDAEIILRPHPTQGLAAAEQVARAHPGLEVRVDGTSPIIPVLAQADLCIGSQSAATLQAALVGTPVIVLNVTGFDWPWPLGGDTPVPVGRSGDQLAEHLRAWRPGAPDNGRGALLEALGADRPDALNRLHALVAERARS